VKDAQAAGELLGGLLHEGDTVLVKGSRGVGLERVLDYMRSEAECDQAPMHEAPALGAAVEQR
jgi:hypothetical protein